MDDRDGWHGAVCHHLRVDWIGVHIGTVDRIGQCRRGRAHEEASSTHALVSIRFASLVRLGTLFGSACEGLVPANILSYWVNEFERRAEGGWCQLGDRQAPTKRTYTMSCEYKSSTIMLESLPQPVDTAEKLGWTWGAVQVSP